MGLDPLKLKESPTNEIVVKKDKNLSMGAEEKPEEEEEGVGGGISFSLSWQ